MGSGSMNFEFCSMRNRSGQTPGRPVYFGERPPDRPFAGDLGNGRNYATRDKRLAGGASGSISKESNIQPTFGMSRAVGDTHFRELCGLKTFSWE